MGHGLIRFTRLAAEDLELLRAWRTLPEVDAQMLGPGPPDAEAQRRWFERVRDDPRSEHWVIRAGDEPVGVINLADIDRGHRRASVGYYLGRPERAPVGGLVLACLVNHAFAREDLALHKLTGEVLAGNQRVLDLHEVLGYRRVGVLREHVCRGATWHDLVLFELRRDEWLDAGNRWARYTATFD